MDYSYFPASQPYQFMGLPPNTYPAAPVPVDDGVRSIEPLDASFIPPGYDAYAFQHGMPTTQGSPQSPLPAQLYSSGSVDSGIGGDMDDSRRTRSSSEEKETGLTPAQSRRKAQNRAAQRAFRERKERHVRDLEAKLSALESSTHSLQSDNERLKLALQRVRTENEILRATSGQVSPPSSRPVSASYPSPGAHLHDDDPTLDEDCKVQVLSDGTIMNSFDKDLASRKKAKGREISASELWDTIQSHPLVKQGLVDIADVCARLKGTATCDGNGPVFEESKVWRAVEDSHRSGGDELI